MVYLVWPCIYPFEAKCECKRICMVVLLLYMDCLNSFMCHPTAGEDHGRSCLQTPANIVCAGCKQQYNGLHKRECKQVLTEPTHLPAAAIKKGLVET